jgi:hypothetical protein
MDATRACILLMDAMGKAAAEEHRRQITHGVFVVDGPGSQGLQALRTIVETLDYRIDVMDADRTNLNDLEVWNSPMREKARFAYGSDRTYVFVLRGWVPAMAGDPRIANFRESFGGAGIVAILSDTAEGTPDGFVACDLSGL